MPFNVFEHIDVSQYKSASCLNDEIEHAFCLPPVAMVILETSWP